MSSNGLSSILGWVSIACWIVVYSPQLLENYTRQSGEGLSVLFVIIWLLGDITNLVGGLLGGLLPTVIFLALYYTICDTTLLLQIYYYRWKSGVALDSPNMQVSETDPLLDGDHDEVSEEVLPLRVLALRYSAALVFVIAVGLVAWWITYDDEDTDLGQPALDSKKWWLVQVLGWTSALLFLGARVPQILKNLHTRCEGLSPALFFFAIFGNATYAWSICAKSMSSDYLIKNAGWLAGSTCTIVLDILVLCQFCYYRYNDKMKVRNGTPLNG